MGFLHQLRHERAIGSQAALRYAAAVRSGSDCAPRLAQMLTVIELALTQIRFEFDKATREILRFDMDEPEFLQARRIDDMAVGGEMVEAGVRRRLTAGAKGCG